MMKKNKLGLIILTSLVVWFFLALGSQAQYSSSGTVDNSDAIGVRIVPNPDHYSIARWYESQGFQGSPQALLVDGYEAIRDGRTVYVNAANIDANPASLKIYTNIYLISYNQNSAPNTVDILGQIVSHWKFNSNLTESASSTCAISSLSCATNTDCPENSLCATTGFASSSCVLKNTKNCLIDENCPTNFFCNNLKSKITRDVKRVGQLEELKEALFNFKKINNRFPSLSAGTYLAGHSISLWPSWTQALLSDLALPQSFIDPINRLGACPGYDDKTCWNKDTQKFVYNPIASSLMLPANSYALVYSTDSQGSNYNLCATLESRSSSSGYRFSPNDPTDSNCVTAGIISSGQGINTAPRLIEKSLAGEASREFNGFFKVIDAENNPLNWSIATNGSWSGWVGGPVLQDTSNPNQKKVYAKSAGPKGTYNMTLTVNDGQGGILTTSTPVTISSSAISLEAADAEYVLDPVNNFEYTFSFGGSNITNPESSYSINQISPPNFNLLNNFTKSFSVIGNKYQVSYRGLIPPSTAFKFYKDTDFKYSVSVTGSNSSVSKNFTIKIKPDKPVLNSSCADSARLGVIYKCSLGSATQGNHTITYSGGGFPAGLNVVNQDLTGTPTAITTGARITLKATNEYDASSTQAFVLKVNSYCGDGIKQTPNTEERGGFYNDGYEDCDGLDGVANTISFDNTKQYGCVTTATSPRPYPIITNNQCVFISPADGGGYCGDGYCTTQYENIGNCGQDCASTAIAISGHVINSTTSAPLNGVNLKILNSTSTVIASGLTGTDGAYTISLISASDLHTITARLNGYQDGTATFTPDVSQIKDFNLAPNLPISISGQVTDYMTSSKLSGVSLKIVNGSGTEVGSAVTASNGTYAISLTPVSALHTITARLNGYQDGTATFTADVSQTKDFNLASPSLYGVARVRLTWNVNPAPDDLDSHLRFGAEHIWFSNMCDVHIGNSHSYCSNDNSTSCSSNQDCQHECPGYCDDGYSHSCNLDSDCSGGAHCINDCTNYCVSSDCDLVNSTATLDRDDTNDDGDNVGLENIRIIRYQLGSTYEYYVHDYSNGHSNHPGSCNFKNAKVDVYNGGGVLIGTYTATNQVGFCFWHVFKMNDTGIITSVNTYNNSNPSPSEP